MQTLELITAAEFLAEAAQTNDRLEYADGEIIYNMAGASKEHEQIVSRILAALFKISSNRQEIYSSNRFLYIGACNKFVLPDVMVVEGEEQIYAEERQGFKPLLNPKIIIEVTSASTKDYDHSEKLECYQQIESVKQIILVSSQKIMVESYTYQSPNQWHFVRLREISQSLDIEGYIISLEEIYRKVEFN